MTTDQSKEQNKMRINDTSLNRKKELNNNIKKMKLIRKTQVRYTNLLNNNYLQY